MEGKLRVETTETVDPQVNTYLAHEYGAKAIKENGEGGKRVRMQHTPPRLQRVKTVSFTDTQEDEDPHPNFSLSSALMQGEQTPEGARDQK